MLGLLFPARGLDAGGLQRQRLGYVPKDEALCELWPRVPRKALHRRIDGWCSGQQLVALSSGEAEFYALGKLVAALLFVKWLASEMGNELKAIARSDSSAARGVSLRTGSGPVKHLEVRFLWIQERVRAKEMAIELSLIHI